jgi:regulatory protein
MDVKQAIEYYCQYQERCHAEVKNKLYELGCTTPEVEQNLAELIERGVLNEERYAKALARGKFKMLKWGRRKVVQQLKLHKISDYCIKKALEEIDEQEYEQTLQKLTEKKLKDLKGEKKEYVLKSKIQRYLLQKGYENDLIAEMINTVLKNKNSTNTDK